MSYTKKIESIENDLKKSIMDFLKENNLGEVSFKNPFKIWVDEEDFDEEPMPVRYLVKGILHDCCVVATSKTDSVYEELLIGELDIYDLSYAYEQLTTGRFDVVSGIS
jgi:hypothetical protein